ncbi:NUDIX hydrolase [Aquipuribacter sp. SD81]|uniref:NUDIX hydrolase n=1 Tax=Aquipuribacter sp. SD81 TaxID=3127703 RepID=UPI0030193AFC
MTGPEHAGTSRWRVHGERSLYESPWLSLRLLDVEQPDGRRYEHHAVRQPVPAACCLVLRDGPDGQEEVLLLGRHRVVTGTWGWEVPAGRVEPGETPAEAAARETREETGWEVADVRHLSGFHPVGGSADHRFEVCAARAVRQVADHDPVEADGLVWAPRAHVRRLVREGLVVEGLSLVALLWWLADLGPGLSGRGGAGAPRRGS